MASVMGICGGLVGPKTENVDFSFVLIVFLKRGGRRREFRSGQNGLDLGRFGVEKVRFLNKTALCLYLELCFPQQREAYFQKNHEKMLPESEKWSQNYVRYIKIPPTWGRIHEDGVKIMSYISIKSPKEATCSNNTHGCDVF